MATTFKNAGRFDAGNILIPGDRQKITMSAYIRVNSRPSAFRRLFARNLLSFQANYASDDSLWTPNLFGVGYAVPGATVPIGSICHLAFVFDADDANRQFFMVNGVKAKVTAGSTVAATGRVSYGQSSGNDFTIQHAFYLDGYAATDEELLSLANGSATAHDVFSAHASGPGVEAMYHSFEGPVGADVQATDAGVVWGPDSRYSPIVVRPTVDDTIKYVEPMVYDPSVRVQKAYVGSSGRTVTIIMADSSGENRIAPSVTSLPGIPSIRVDGGSPIPLAATPETGLFSPPTADAMLLALPPGVVVEPGQSVVLDAPSGWFPAGVNRSPEIVGEPVANYAGMPVSSGLWPNAKPIRLGANNSGAGSSNREQILRTSANVANYVTVGGMGIDFWPDGTYKGAVSNIPLTNSGYATAYDVRGIPGMSGPWVVRWDDYDHANPTTLSLVFTGGGVVAVEDELCRNLGDDQGRGKVRVYDVRVQAPRPCALTADVDAAATSIPFTLVDGSPQLRPPMMYGMHLQLGDEQIRITDVNAAGNVFTGCVRGWNGTTAAAHANGESFTARAINSWISVFLTTSSDDPPNTHYTNLAVYEPDGWDAPSPRAKVSLPPHDNRLVNKSRKPYLEPGVGVFRYMTETPTQGSYRQAEHPEHYTRLDDPIWSYPRGQMVYHFSEVKPFDLASTPYAYTSTPWPSTETYTAVLGAPITTTPPSGTVETITITDGRATPVLHGQSLFGGGETMRVVGLPLAGDEYQVERGAENTPTATHAAGPITVGYRVPIASMNQIQHPGSSIIHYYEATLDESLSSPATFGAGLYDRWGGPSSATGVPALNADANVTARRSLTLTAPLTSSSLTLAVAPADPGDWDVIAKKMCVTIGAESLSVTGVDAAAGTVTVASRPSGSQGYPTGTPLTTSAAGLLFRSADGLSQAYNGMFTNAAAMYALGANRVLLSTYNDSGTGLTVGTTVARAQTLDPTKAKTIPYVYPSVNGTFELTVEHTKMAPKCWHWLNVPFRATDAAVYAAAKVVRDNLPPGRKVIFELGNELWNTAFHHTPTANRTSGLCGVGTARDLLILRSKTAFDVVKRCFAEVGREDEVLLSICWQTAYDVLADCRRLGVNPDVAAVAPYLTPGATPLFGTVVNNIDDGQVCDLFAFHMFYMFNPGTLRYTGNVAKASLAAHEAATGKRVIAAAYEGGVEELLGSKNSTYVVNPNFRRTRDVLKHPAFYHTTRDIYAAFREVGGIEVFAEFMVAAYPNKSVTWGMLQAPTQKPGYGDGRNGGVNNLDYSFMNPTDLVHEGGDGITESTRMQGWLDHQQAWMAANELNPDPDPHDPEPTDPGTTPQPPSIHIARPRKFVISRFRSRFG